MNSFIIFLLLTPVLLAAANKRQVGNLILEDMPEIPSRIVERMNQYQNVRSAGFVDWDPSGEGMLIATRFAETTQLHYVARPDGARRQLTFFPEPVSYATFCPDPTRQLYLLVKDTGGNEFYQIHAADRRSGRFHLLTDGKSRHEFNVWNKKGSRFIFTSTRRNGKDNDLYLAETERPNDAKLLLTVEGTWSALDWSDDDRYVLLGEYLSVTESRHYLLEVETGIRRQLHEGQTAAYGQAAFLHRPDGNPVGIVYTSDESSEFQRLTVMDLQSGKKELLSAEIPWDITDFALSEDGHLLAFVSNEGGLSKLHLLEMTSRQPLPVAPTPVGVVYGLRFDPPGRRLALSINTPQTPGDVFVLDVASGQFTRWTYSEAGGLNPETFVLPTIVEYPSFDGRKIPALYYAPAQTSSPTPVIINIHGGPEAQSMATFSSTIQYWVNELGIAVLLPNVRGSTGYGKTYVSLDNGYLREDAVKDIGALLDWVARQPALDANRVAVYGGSYGGYMVLASMAHYNDRLKCGVNIVGISNFVTFLESTQEYRRDLRRVEYGDERDPQMRRFLQDISPTNNAHKITKPLFVAQGKNDPRVPYTEAEQIVATMRKNGQTVWYLLALDEGHGFRKKNNRDTFHHAMTYFWEQYLLP